MGLRRRHGLDVKLAIHEGLQPWLELSAAHRDSSL
jgi:hypothetical protein